MPTADEDAFAFLNSTLKQYGLEALGSQVRNYLEQGYTTDRVNIEIQDTAAWKKRFSGNEARRKAGLPVLSPAEYLATESSYRQIMAAAGLPPTFYDQPSDFEKWIGTDVSPNEVQARVKTAQSLIEATDPNVRKEFEKFYTRGDLVAYALDPKRTADVLARQEAAARTSAAATSQGVTVDKSLAERIATTGVDENQARSGFGNVSALEARGSDLAAVYGGTYTQDDAVDETFFASQAAKDKSRRLASAERGTFSGSTGVGQSSLGKSTKGSL